MSKYSPVTTKTCEFLRKLTPVRLQLTHNKSYLELYDTAKNDENKPVYLEIDVSGVGLGTKLFQIREGMTCPRNRTPNNSILHIITLASKSLSNAEMQYSSIEREVTGILHGLQKNPPLLFHHTSQGTNPWQPYSRMM